MVINNTSEENKELNKELRRLKNRAKRLILSDYYDHIELSELQYQILQQITNAESHKNINSYLWNTGMLQSTLNDIARYIKQARKNDR